MSEKNAEPTTTPTRLRRPPTTVMITKTSASRNSNWLDDDRRGVVGQERPGDRGEDAGDDEGDQGVALEAGAEAGRHPGSWRMASSARPVFVDVRRQST